MRTPRAFFVIMSAVAVTFSVAGQSVISTHSGVIYYFDGAVYLGGQPLQPHLGTFPTVPRGAELRTAQGRAEVLLTPGVFLRMGEQSSIRLVSNDLANTQVELRSGSAIVDSGQPGAGTSVTLVYKDWQVRSTQPGSYRIDSDPPRLFVVKGDAEVTGGTGGQPVKVDQGMDLPFAKVLVPEQAAGEPVDSLSVWDQGRGDSIVADNAITQQIDQDPAAQAGDPDGFSYFPFLGVPSVGLYSSPYGSVIPAQPGFYSMYLPGYTYAPLLIGIMGRSPLNRLPLGTLRLGSPGIGGIGAIGHIAPRPLTPRPASVPMRPMARPAIRR